MPTASRRRHKAEVRRHVGAGVALFLSRPRQCGLTRLRLRLLRLSIRARPCSPPGALSRGVRYPSAPLPPLRFGSGHAGKPRYHSPLLPLASASPSVRLWLLRLRPGIPHTPLPPGIGGHTVPDHPASRLVSPRPSPQRRKHRQAYGSASEGGRLRSLRAVLRTRSRTGSAIRRLRDCNSVTGSDTQESLADARPSFCLPRVPYVSRSPSSAAPARRHPRLCREPATRLPSQSSIGLVEIGMVVYHAFVDY